MCMNKSTNNPCCCLFSIVGTLLAAIGIAAIFYSGLITTIPILLYATLVLGILVLLYVFVTAFCGGKHQCAILNDSCLITAAVGSIITSVFALAATSLVVGSLSVGILIGAVAYFLISNLFNIVNLIIRKLCNGYCKD